MQPQESQGSPEPSQEASEADPSQEQAPSDPEVQADPESPEVEGEQEAKDGEPETEGEASEEEKTPAGTPVARHKRNGWKVKIDRLERQNQILLEQLRAGQGTRSPPPPPPADEPAKTPEQLQADKAEEYVRTILRSELAKQQGAQKQAEAQAEFQKRTAEAKAKYPDFEEVIESVEHIPTSAALRQAVLTSKKSADIMYQLAKNPAELARISALPPLEAALEIGALGANASGATQQTPKPAVRPPAPPSRVGGSSSSTRRLDELPLAEYKRAMASRRR